MKTKPIEERVAELFGRTGFRDLRDGISQGSFISRRGFGLSTSDVAAQLGFVQRDNSLTMLLAMETRLASTLVHEKPLLGIWQAMNREAKTNQDYASRVLSRLGCDLAIRKCAGAEFTPSSIAFYAYLINRRHSHLAYSIRVADAWLGNLWQTGVSELKRRLRVAA